MGGRTRFLPSKELDDNTKFNKGLDFPVALPKPDRRLRFARTPILSARATFFLARAFFHF